jgi:microcystin-dependent protein
MTSRNRDYLTFTAHQKPTVGDSKFSAVQYDHLGWMKCDGRTLNVTDFQFLFYVIGYSFGGSGNQFNLPNPFGRVPAAIGQGTDVNNSTFTIKLGDSIGEYIHQLTIAEMPSHNHGVAAGGQVSTNNSTSVAYTGLTVLNSTTMITASQPAHSHTAQANAAGATGGGFGTNTGGANSQTPTTNTAQPAITITDPSHKHDVNDPGHAHTLNPAGLDRPHNNVQPTLGMGNMFIYSGVVGWGNYPYTTGPSPITYMPSSNVALVAPSGTPNNIW